MHTRILRRVAVLAASAVVGTACSDATDSRGVITGTRPVASRESRVFTQRERLGNLFPLAQNEPRAAC